MKNRKAFLGTMVLTVLVAALFAGTCYAGPAGVVAAEQVNLRSAPSLEDSAVIGVLYKKDVVQILISSRAPWDVNGFVRVKASRTQDRELAGAEGWVAKQYLYVPNPD